MNNRELRIDEIAWLCTHNAYNSDDEIGAKATLPGGTNQNHSIIEQLNSGVRVFMIDVKNSHGGLRVCHYPDYYEDLCDLLIKYKIFLTDEKNKDEIIILMMEVDGDVPAEWIANTFYGQGPTVRNQDYDMTNLLYEHPSSTSKWPSQKDLVASGKRLIVFRETDDGKGKANSGMKWYHDMWLYWLETPYGNSSWNDLQEHSYQLLRGDINTASFFNLNHFVNTGIFGSGSAGFAQGMNMDDYLYARSMVAWRFHGRRPTLSVDFYKSLSGAVKTEQYDTLRTAERLNNTCVFSGSIINDQGKPFNSHLTWENIPEIDLKLTGNGLSANDYRLVRNADEPPASSKATSYGSIFSFPKITAKKGATDLWISPEHPEYSFKPDKINILSDPNINTLDVKITATKKT